MKVALVGAVLPRRLEALSVVAVAPLPQRC
jgi:hypothetical protein